MYKNCVHFIQPVLNLIKKKKKHLRVASKLTEMEIKPFLILKETGDCGNKHFNVGGNR